MAVDNSHVIGWVVAELGLDVSGRSWFVLTGSGFRGENPGLYSSLEAAEQVVAEQVPSRGVTWHAMAVIDQGDNT